jgi:hypothetical protein
LASLYQCSSDEQGNRFATFYLMNTSRNRNRWGVTNQALEEALPTLKGVPIGMGAGYKVDRHYPDGQTIDCGAFTAFEKPGAYALGTAKITDEKTWQLMQNKKLGPTSVVIRSFRDTCSVCRQNLSATKDPFGSHKCLKEGDAYAKVESFQFKRVDFVNVPAYPQAGVLEMANTTDTAQALELFAGFYASQGRPEEGLKPNIKHKERENEKLAENDQRMASLEQANAKLTLDLAAAVAKSATAETNVADLKAQLNAIQKEKHDALVDEVYEARAQAKIAGKEEEKTMLAKLTDEMLTIMKSDALKIAQVISIQESPAPKTRYNAKAEESTEAAVKEMRAQMGFPAIQEKIKEEA